MFRNPRPAVLIVTSACPFLSVSNVSEQNDRLILAVRSHAGILQWWSWIR